MKHILTYLVIFWFWFGEYRALSYFSDCYLESTIECPDCIGVDLNNDKTVNLVDYALLVE